ncbi:MAG TPA: cell wall-binding repeat-containing protein, partial [Egibacteraceae bacterium]|nr:cell wall-binding repeat-containing protein [Egibacteraceae bacterium]
MPVPHRSWRRPALHVAVALAVLLAGLPFAAPAHAAAGDRWSLAGQDPVTTAVALSRFAFPDGAPSALLARADAFPDALASGLLQDEGPLLLTAGAALDTAAREELARLGVERVTVLGGTAAITEAVAEELRQAGYRVSRLSGGTRVDTAVAVASSRPASRTVLLARAFGGSGDASQGFADALSAGAWAAASGYPVLLSETASLSAATAAYLRAAAVRTVIMVGGAAALSAQVEQQLLALGVGVRRVSGAERAATAVAVAEAQGWDSSADVSQVVVVPGRGDSAWAAGFGAAALAAGGATAVVLAEGDALPTATRRFLRAGSADVVCAPLLARARCDEAAEELGTSSPELAAFAGTGAADQERGADGERSYTVTVDGGGPVTLALVDARASAAGAPGWALDDDGDGAADLASGPVITGVGGRAVTG